METDLSLNALYIKGQMERMECQKVVKHSLQFRSFEGKTTNWLAITDEQLKAIQKILLEGAV